MRCNDAHSCVSAGIPRDRYYRPSLNPAGHARGGTTCPLRDEFVPPRNRMIHNPVLAPGNRGLVGVSSLGIKVGIEGGKEVRVLWIFRQGPRL